MLYLNFCWKTCGNDLSNFFGMILFIQYDKKQESVENETNKPDEG